MKQHNSYSKIFYILKFIKKLYLPLMHLCLYYANGHTDFHHKQNDRLFYHYPMLFATTIRFNTNDDLNTVGTIFLV